MTAAWMAYALLASALVAAGAYALATVARMAKLPTRWIWGVASCASVALTFLAPLRARGTVAVLERLPAAPSTVSGSVAKHAPGLGERIAMATATISSATMHALGRLASALPPRADRWLVIGCLVLSALLVGLLVAVHARFARRRRRWPSAEVAGSRVRVAPDVGPAVMGVARPEIVVPRWLLARTAHEQALVVAHEAEHVRGGDPALLGAAWLLVALVPWNLAAWWMLSRLRLAVELDCDARVLRRGVAPRAYGSLLIDLAGRCSGFPAGAPALADTPSHLERRLVAMRPDRIRFPLLRGVGAGALALVAILSACEAKMPTQDDVTSMDAAKAEQVATALQMQKAKVALDQSMQLQYFIDGRPATTAEAYALPADRIATMNIAKSNAAGGPSEIHIRTMDGADTLRMTRRVDEVAAATREARLEGAVQATLHASHEGEPGAAAPKAFAGLLYIDGVLSSHGALATLDRNEIASVEVLKGEAAKQRYADPAAANGVIVITTTRGAKR